jgi:hypothetical protein
MKLVETMTFTDPPEPAFRAEVNFTLQAGLVPRSALPDDRASQPVQEFGGVPKLLG